MPTLLDLFRLNKKALSYNEVTDPNIVPAHLRNLPPSPVKPEWDIRSGLPEPGLGQVTPEEWLPPGAGMKIAALAKSGIAPLAAGIIKNRGGVWHSQSLPHMTRRDSFVPSPSQETTEYFGRHATEADRAAVKYDFENNYTPVFGITNPAGIPEDLVDRVMVAQAMLKHYKDPSYLPFMQHAPQVAADKWAQGPLANYITRDMATEGDPIRALAEQGISHLGSDQTKKMPRALAGPGRESLQEVRVRAGFPPEETAKTQLGRIWERIADKSIHPWAGKNEYGNTVHSYFDPSQLTPELDNKLESLRGIIEDGIRRGNINPGSVSRGNFTVADAVRYADKERKIAEKNALNPDVFKEYPETGHRWVQLNKPGQFDAESDAMRHSARGYEPTSPEGEYYGLGGFAAIKSGKAKVFSLRDASGKPSVTVEIEALPDGSHRVVQVKGRANSNPKPEYSQMIEDLKRQFEQ